MSKCDDVCSQIPAWLDKELSISDAAQIEAHVRECTACAQMLTECRTLKSVAQVAPRPTPVDLWTHIHTEIASTPEQDLAAERRAMRQEMQVLRDEVAALRRELAPHAPAPFTRSTALNLPDAPQRSLKQYRLV